MTNENAKKAMRESQDIVSAAIARGAGIAEWTDADVERLAELRKVIRSPERAVNGSPQG